MTSGLWSDPPPRLVNSVHLWLADSKREPKNSDSILLDKDEQIRWRRFHFDADRRKFLFAHVFLRRVLAYYLDREPGELSFRVGEYGKPKLDATELAFNLSHSGHYCLLAVSTGGDIGVDVEVHRGQRRFEALAERCFDPSECAVLESLPEHERVQYFYDTWAMKEAVIKADGKGLAMPLREFGFRLPKIGGRIGFVWGNTALTAYKPWRIVLYRHLADASMALCLRGSSASEAQHIGVFDCEPGVSWRETGILPTLDGEYVKF